MQTYSLNSVGLYELVIKPAFADIVPDGFPFKGSLNEFSVMDNVVSKRTIIDIRRMQNILQRRDASCDLNYKKVMGATTRSISTEEAYAGTQFCRQSFYQDDLRDFRNDDPVFEENILRVLQGAVNTDICTNAYFGDRDRVVPLNSQFSLNVFDGVFKWLKRYTQSGVIPTSQTIAIPDGTDYSTTPADAFALIKKLYDSQPTLMFAFSDDQKAFYVSKEIAKGYEDYMIATSQESSAYVSLAQTGIRQLAYKGIPILIEPLWSPVIYSIKGSAGYAAILTVRNNFVFATDTKYGEGESGEDALMVWYERKELQWYFQLFLKAGTQIALPEFIVYALSSWS